MDSVRFGRALGFGARSAAKAIAGAVDAATAPSPSTARTPLKPSINQHPPTSRPPAPSIVTAAARTHAQAQQARKGFARGRKRFGEAVWGPVARLSGVLWLEMTGAFFGIFALFAGQAVWSHHADFHPGAAPIAHRNAFVFLAMTAVFGYFCLSSFIRAHRRQRRR